MADIFFHNYDNDPNHNIYWYINTSTGPQSGRLTGPIVKPLPSNALSIGWLSDMCQITAYWNPFSKNYAYEVYSLPYDLAFAIPPDSSGEMIVVAAEGAAAPAVQWVNNKKSSAEWAIYTNSREDSGTVLGWTTRPPSPLPATRPLYLGWKVKAYSGRPLLNLMPPRGVTYQLILED